MAVAGWHPFHSTALCSSHMDFGKRRRPLSCDEQGHCQNHRDLVVILNSDDCFRPEPFARSLALCNNMNPGTHSLEMSSLWMRKIREFIAGRKWFMILKCCFTDWITSATRLYLCAGRFISESGTIATRNFLTLLTLNSNSAWDTGGVVSVIFPGFLVNYRYHSFGQSADLRITRNMAKESAIIRREYGNPGGWIGKCLKVCFKAKRQSAKTFPSGQMRPAPRHMEAPLTHAQKNPNFVKPQSRRNWLAPQNPIPTFHAGY